MSSFFTAPASQRKRKRDDNTARPSSKRRNISSTAIAKPVKSKPTRTQRDESISSSGSESENRREKQTDDQEFLSESESEGEEETGLEKRLRLAEAYLRNIQGEAKDEVGFDAADVDADLIAARLQEDVAETKGRLHRRIASTLDFPKAIKTQFRYTSLATTSVASCAGYAYTVSKDIQLIKWELPTPYHRPPDSSEPPTITPRAVRRRPTKLIGTRGNRKMSGVASYQHHTAPILCVAASSTGRFVATGGADKRLIIWSAEDLKPLRVFTQHRDAVTSLVFRKGTNQLYSTSKDRTIKTWSLDELAYVETLFGHQDEVVDVAALGMERCVSVGARDRTARVWRIVEETQLVFRGGGSSDKKKGRKDNDGVATATSFNEGSIDRVALIDEDTFVTGSDNGSLSLWSLQKKKPVFTLPLAHGLDPAVKPEEFSADVHPSSKVPDRQPRWITALATVPLSDLIISGSWDGEIRIWKVSEDKRTLESVGFVGKVGSAEGHQERLEFAVEKPQSINGYINDLSVFERGDRGRDGLCIVAAVGSEPRLGRWKTVKAKNGAVVFEVPRIEKIIEAGAGEVEPEQAEDGA